MCLFSRVASGVYGEVLSESGISYLAIMAVVGCVQYNWYVTCVVSVYLHRIALRELRLASPPLMIQSVLRVTPPHRENFRDRVIRPGLPYLLSGRALPLVCEFPAGSRVIQHQVGAP